MELVAADSMISRLCTVLISTKYILIDKSEAIWKCLLIKTIGNINWSKTRENMWLSKVCFMYSILNYSMHSCKTNHKQTLPTLKLLKWSVTPEYLQCSSPSSWGNVIENAKWSWKLNRFDILVVLISSVFPLLSSLFKCSVIPSLLHPFQSPSAFSVIAGRSGYNFFFYDVGFGSQSLTAFAVHCFWGQNTPESIILVGMLQGRIPHSVLNFANHRILLLQSCTSLICQ